MRAARNYFVWDLARAIGDERQRQERAAGKARTPEHEMRDGVAYANESPVTDERLDWLARYGTPRAINLTEIRYIAEELWQRRKQDGLRAALSPPSPSKANPS